MWTFDLDCQQKNKTLCVAIFHFNDQNYFLPPVSDDAVCQALVQYFENSFPFWLLLLYEFHFKAPQERTYFFFFWLV